jgi:hypothetical protein
MLKLGLNKGFQNLTKRLQIWEWPVVVKALCFKQEGRGFKTRWGEWISSMDLSFRVHWALGFTQPLTETSTRSRKIILQGSSAWPVHRTNYLIANSEPTVYTMWDPQHLTALYASTACYGDSFTLWRRSVLPVRYELDSKYCYK